MSKSVIDNDLERQIGWWKNKAVIVDEYILESLITEDPRSSHSEYIVNRSRLYWSNRSMCRLRRERLILTF
jgi:hypothetical protein